MATCPSASIDPVGVPTSRSRTAASLCTNVAGALGASDWWQRAYDGVDRLPAAIVALQARGARADGLLEDGRCSTARRPCRPVGPGFTTQLVAGVPSTLTIEARDAFGNLRKGDDTPHFVHGYYGGEPEHKGASDYFLVVFDHQAMDYTFTTSTAIQTITINARQSIRAGPASDDGLQSYRLRFAGRTTMDIPVNATAAAVEAPLEMARRRPSTCPFRAATPVVGANEGRGANHREWGASGGSTSTA